MTTEHRVAWVEKLCDLIEALDPDLFNYFGNEISIPASLAAIRLHFYVGSINFIHTCVYYKLAYMLMNDAEKWNKLEKNEKQALLSHIGVLDVMVYKF